jgi:hypothetical protein
VEPARADADPNGLVGVIGSYFATAYDEPRHTLELPVEVTSGRDEGLCIVDQVIRGTAIVGRATGDFGAVALKVRGTGKPVHVAITIQLDDMSTRWWSDKVRPPRLTPERPRLVLVRAQGDLKGAALLARRQAWRRASNSVAEIGFDLTADELDRDGLLVVELAEAPRPSWVEGRLSRQSALGLRIDRITVREQGDGERVRFSYRPTGCDLALLPPDGPSSFRLDVNTVEYAPPLPRTPTGKITRRTPARAVFKAGRIARRVAVSAGSKINPDRPGGRFGVLATDLSTGAPIGAAVVGRRPGSLDVRLESPPRVPILIGLDAAHPGLSCRVVTPR